MDDVAPHLPYGYIASGSGRHAYRYDEHHVIKVPFNRYGSLQNDMEAKLYDKYKDTEFAPLLASCEQLLIPEAGRVLKMEWVEEIEYEEYNQLGPTADDYFTNCPTADVYLYAKFLNVVVRGEHLHKDEIAHIRVWGRKNGTLKLFDYGRTEGMAFSLCHEPAN